MAQAIVAVASSAKGIGLIGIGVLAVVRLQQDALGIYQRELDIGIGLDLTVRRDTDDDGFAGLAGRKRHQPQLLGVVDRVLDRVASDRRYVADVRCVQ